jgi:hypothetical protein
MSEPTRFDIKEYRQPLVTSLGVVLGFLVGAMLQWVSEAHFALVDASDWIVFVGCLTGVAILLRVLFRILSPVAAGDSLQQLQQYRRTLRLYVSGIAIAFLSLITPVFL